MQLTIEVLPAPFGPIMENSSPSFTVKLTSVSARIPPKRSETARTSNARSTPSSRHARRLSLLSSTARRCPFPRHDFNRERIAIVRRSSHSLSDAARNVAGAVARLSPRSVAIRVGENLEKQHSGNGDLGLSH